MYSLGLYQHNQKAYLLLDDGCLLEGVSFGSTKTSYAEIVFNTGMTGYQEILTDPSYAGQAVVMTYPLMGNYGINLDDVESDKIHPSGFIVKEICADESNWKSLKGLSEYLNENDITGIANLDTRMLTKKIRTKGTMNCLMTTNVPDEDLKSKLKSYKFPADIVKQVSRNEITHLNASGKRIAIFDYGIKNSIISHFQQCGCNITLYPWNVDADIILKENYEALILSNGPGDPKDVGEGVNLIKKLMGKLPIYGICLGHQILALALGADTYKLKFGHRGSNHPVYDMETGKVYITSQNHGYAVSRSNMPDTLKITHININDDTIEGFSAPDLNIRSVQFHPEAGPGPKDANFIFKTWVESLQ